MKSVAFCLQSQEQEEALIISANVIDGLDNEQVFLQHLKRAVQEWTVKSIKGKNAFYECNCDLNVKKLAMYLQSPGQMLETFLAKHGICDLDINEAIKPVKTWVLEETLVEFAPV